MDRKPDIRKTILTQMKVDDDVKDFIEGIQTSIIQEWAYVCAADGMDLEQMKRAVNVAENDSKNAASVFIMEREQFFRDHYENNRELTDRVTKLHDKVESMFNRAATVENSLDDTIRKALRDKDELFGKVIESKNEIIHEKDTQIQSLKDQLEDQKNKEKANREALDQRLKKILERHEKISKDFNNQRSYINGENIVDDETPIYNHPTEVLKDAADLSNDLKHNGNTEWYPVIQRRGFLSQLRADWTVEKFVKLFIDNESLSDEQKDYLIRCLEEGDPISMIKKYAISSLSIKQMEEIRRIARKGRI